MAKKTDDTNTIDVDEIARQDERLGVFLRLLLSLPRPLPGPVVVKMLGDVRKVEGMIRQRAVDARREAERRAAAEAHENELQPLRDELAAYAETVKSAGEMELRPFDVDRLADLAERAEVDFIRALSMAGLSEESPAVRLYREIRQRQTVTVR